MAGIPLIRKTALAALACLMCAAVPGVAQTQKASVERFVTSSRVVRAGEVLGATDLTLRPGVGAGGLVDPAAAVGLEARVTLYPGRPIAPGDLAPPAMVDRNQIVTIRFVRGGLLIETDGRALDRGAHGGRIRVMNLTSRATVVAQVVGASLVEVGR
jgi:flagella basal body P-ring formation protein FlgA